MAVCGKYAPVASHGVVVVVEHVLGMVVGGGGVTDAIQAPDRKENHDRPAFVRYNKGGLLCCHSCFDCLPFSASMVPFQSVGAPYNAVEIH